jgi:predicted kinase
MKITILRGIPGSGKSSLIPKEDGKSRIVVSADNYFIQPDGTYLFDATKLAEAHNGCLREYVAVVTNPDGHPDELVVDNTNISIEEVGRYYALGLAYGHQVRVVTLLCDPEVAAERNVHGVQYPTCHRMNADILMLINHKNHFVPPWWSWVTKEQNGTFDWDKEGW